MKCGTVDTGKYCSNCGALLSSSSDRPIAAFADGFLKVQERWRYLRTLGRILRSPTRNTLALYEEGDATGAFSFLQMGVFVYTLLVLSKIFSGGPLVSELAVPAFVLLGMSVYLVLFYWLAQRRSPAKRSSRDFLVLSAYMTGFMLPFESAGLQLPVIVGPVLAFALVALLWLMLVVYVLRVWSRFWQLRKRTVLGCMFVASLPWSIIAGIIGGIVAASASQSAGY